LLINFLFFSFYSLLFLFVGFAAFLLGIASNVSILSDDASSKISGSVVLATGNSELNSGSIDINSGNSGLSSGCSDLEVRPYRVNHRSSGYRKWKCEYRLSGSIFQYQSGDQSLNSGSIYLNSGTVSNDNHGSSGKQHLHSGDAAEAGEIDQ